jgi:chitinase
MVSAFGSTDMPTARSASTVCTSLAQFVLDNNLDGVDLDYEDNAAMELGLEIGNF